VESTRKFALALVPPSPHAISPSPSPLLLPSLPFSSRRPWSARPPVPGALGPVPDTLPYPARAASPSVLAPPCAVLAPGPLRGRGPLPCLGAAPACPLVAWRARPPAPVPARRGAPAQRGPGVRAIRSRHVSAALHACAGVVRALLWRGSPCPRRDAWRPVPGDVLVYP
jgi:hypothetical protein